MPRLDEFQPQIASPQLRAPRLSQGGTATADIGGRLQQLGADISQIQERQRLDADKTAVQSAENSRDSWANDTLYNPEGGAFTQKGANALNLQTSVLEGYDKHVQETLAGMTSDRARKAFLQSSFDKRQAMASQLGSYEIAQRNDYEDATAAARVSTATETGALSYNDPRVLAQSKASIVSTVDSQAERRGWDDDKRADVTLKSVSGFHGSVVERMLADKRIGMAGQYIKANNAELTADDRIKYGRAVEAAGDNNRTELQGAVRARIADLNASYRAGLPVPAGQELSAGQIEAAFPGKGAEIYTDLQANKRLGFDLVAVNQQSPAQIAENRQKYAVTEGGVGAADAIQRQNDYERAVRESAEARQKDPAQFAINNNLGYNPLPPGGAELAGELKNREAINGVVSAKVGFPVPMLTPTEAKTMGAQLDAADDAQTAQSFDFLRQSLGNDAYEAVMRQIAPDSPVKAYAGQIYGRPQTVLVRSHLASPDEVTTQRVVAETMVTGENLINRTKQTKGEDGKPAKNLLLPDKATFDAEFTDAVGTAFAGNSQALELAQQSAYAFYVGESAKTGRLTNDKNNIDSDDVRRAIRLSIGERVNLNGNGDAMAPIGMNSDDFEAQARAHFIQEAAGIGIDEKSAIAAYPSIGLVNFGAQQYMVTQGRTPFSVKGRPLILDLSRPLGKIARPELSDASSSSY